MINVIKNNQMKPISWTGLFSEYKGLWVALEQDEKTVVSSGKNAKKVYEKAKESGLEIPILFKVPTETVPYIGQEKCNTPTKKSK